MIIFYMKSKTVWKELIKSLIKQRQLNLNTLVASLVNFNRLNVSYHKHDIIQLSNQVFPFRCIIEKYEKNYFLSSVLFTFLFQW